MVSHSCTDTASFATPYSARHNSTIIRLAKWMMRLWEEAAQLYKEAVTERGAETFAASL